MKVAFILSRFPCYDEAFLLYLLSFDLRRAHLALLTRRPGRYVRALLRMVLVEALAARNAVVTTRFGSVEELVRDGETGLLVPPRDSDVLAAALSRLALDPGLRTRLAEAGHRQVARDFDLSKTAEAYVRHFQETGGVGGRPAGAAAGSV